MCQTYIFSVVQCHNDNGKMGVYTSQGEAFLSVDIGSCTAMSCEMPFTLVNLCHIDLISKRKLVLCDPFLSLSMVSRLICVLVYN